ncbi:MAG: tetratricopeptide repeat protein [Verrucomicrobiota bacterium]
MTVTAVAVLVGCQSQQYPDDLLGWGFKFASTLETDKKDQAKYQEKVLRQMADLDEMDRAINTLPQLEGWRKVAVAADITKVLAAEGDDVGARALIASAEEWAKPVTGWQKERIRAHLAEAYAFLGDTDKQSEVSGSIDDKEEKLKNRLADSFAMVASGDFEQAIEDLGAFHGQANFTLNLNLVSNYLTLFKLKQFQQNPEKKRILLNQATKVARAMKFWVRCKVMADLAVLYIQDGDTDTAISLLQESEAVLQEVIREPRVAIPVLVDIAVAYHKADQMEESHRLMAQATELLNTDTMVEWDRSLAYPMVAYGAYICLSPAEGEQLFDTCLQRAEEQVNSRGKVIIVVDTCIFMNRCQFPFTRQVQSRLKQIYHSLGDPW